jgi:hypothetical protein
LIITIKIIQDLLRKVMTSIPETHNPEVGIFWLHGKKLLKHSVPLEEGMEYGDFINGPLGHYEFWEKNGNRMPGLQDREYDQVPRGRVVYSGKEQTFFVYSSRKLIADTENRKILLEAFHLTEETVVFRSDEHYEDVSECFLEEGIDGHEGI